MSFFTNKHVITAMIVAPVLAFLSYYLVDSAVREQPNVAEQGQSYPLVAKSNCRFTSGVCDLENADFSAQLTVEKVGAQARLLLTSPHQLQQVNVGFKRPDDEQTSGSVMPQKMSQDTAGKWQITVPVMMDQDTNLMLVVQSSGVNYYAETSMAFSEYQTSFNKKF